MKVNPKSVATPIEMGLIEDVRSYWATHFYSILQCLHNHKNLMHSPRALDTYPTWSLRDLRGEFPMNFFAHIERYMMNWGVQYFIVNFLNQKIGANVASELIERISQIYGDELKRDYDQFSFHMSGNDSSLTADLSNKFGRVFPEELNGEKPTLDTLIAYSDLCLIVKNTVTDESLGIFGEIEGLHGNKLRSEKYWGKKQNFCIFSLGVIDGDQKRIFAENIVRDNICRINILFERTHTVVSDFSNVIYYLKTFFMSGKDAQFLKTDAELEFFLEMIRNFWSRPIDALLTELCKYIANQDIVGNNVGELKIITDLQAE
jgi:hypothetical protein